MAANGSSRWSAAAAAAAAEDVFVVGEAAAANSVAAAEDLDDDVVLLAVSTVASCAPGRAAADTSENGFNLFSPPPRLFPDTIEAVPEATIGVLDVVVKMVPTWPLEVEDTNMVVVPAAAAEGCGCSAPVAAATLAIVLWGFSKLWGCLL